MPVRPPGIRAIVIRRYVKPDQQTLADAVDELE